MRNLVDVIRSGDAPKQTILLRDRRCKAPAVGSRGQEYLDAFEKMGGVYLLADGEEVSLLNAIYDTLVAIEEHDLAIGAYKIDKAQFVEFLRSEGLGHRTRLLRSAATPSDAFARAIGMNRPAPGSLNPPPSSRPTASSTIKQGPRPAHPLAASSSSRPLFRESHPPAWQEPRPAPTAAPSPSFKETSRSTTNSVPGSAFVAQTDCVRPSQTRIVASGSPVPIELNW